MAEPKVGMKFSSYLELGKLYEKKSASASISLHDVQVSSNLYDKATVFSTSYYNKGGYCIGVSTLETNGKKQTSRFCGESFAYEGEGSIYDSDIKNTKIYGTTTHAVDLNNNGIVDKGEIFPNKK